MKGQGKVTLYIVFSQRTAGSIELYLMTFNCGDTDQWDDFLMSSPMGTMLPTGQFDEDGWGRGKSDNHRKTCSVLVLKSKQATTGQVL